MSGKTLNWKALNKITPPTKVPQTQVPETQAHKTQVPPTKVPQTQVPETQAQSAEVPETQARERHEPRSESADVRWTEVRETQVPETQVSPSPVVDFRAIRLAGRYLQIDQAVLDDFLPRLDPYHQLVYLRLLRLIVGFKDRAECLVSHEKLAEKTNLSVSTVKRACNQMRAKGYITWEGLNGGPRSERGCRFRLLEPASLLQTEVKGTQVKGTQVPRAHMKDMKTNHEKVPVAIAPAVDVFQIRIIAARLFEAHRGEPGFNHGRLRQLVQDGLIGQGIAPDGDLIEEAIRGMAE